MVTSKPTDSTSVSKVEEPKHGNSHRLMSSSKKLPDIFRIVPVILSYMQKSVRIFAYLDDGSNLTSLEEIVAKQIGAYGTKEKLCVLWSFGDSQLESDSKRLSIKIRGVHDDAEVYSLDNVRTVKKLVLPTQSITLEWIAQYSYMKDIPITLYNVATPQMIIGLEYSKLMVSLETIEGHWTQPIVCRTRLGWVVQGPNDHSLDNSFSQYSLNMCECQTTDDDLHKLVQQFFSIENVGVKISEKLLESKSMARARQILERTTIKKGAHYETALLWKQDKIEFPDSYGLLSMDEFQRAENTLYKQAQYESFMEELVIVRWNETAPVEKQKEFNKTSVIRTCSPYLDDDGVLRVKGRIDAAKSISDSVKRPIILDKDHWITHLIVDFFHRKYRHLHHQTVLNEVKQKFWIPKLRVVLGMIRNKCQKCKNTAAVPRVPEMAPLPLARLAIYSRSFTYAGIDYFGPILVVVNRGTQKRWGVLITCLTTRAVHLEIAYSLNTDSCIMAIRNFIGRFGIPKGLYSDNGTNMHGADNALKIEFAKLDQDRIQEKFTTSEMFWTFNPPAAPHFTGSVERMVGIVKKCLDEVMTIRYPTDEVLKNLFIETENIVNSRPLTYVSLDSPDDEVLTPNHFLLGSSNGLKPPGNFTDKDLLKNTWKTVQIMADKFWKAFVLEYLPTLLRRTKWHKDVPPIKVDDIVLIVDENFKRNTWPKGIVVEVFKDKIGKIRSAKVRTELGTFLTRPVVKLAVLDVRRGENQQIQDGSDKIHNNNNSVKLIASVNGGQNVVEQH